MGMTLAEVRIEALRIADRHGGGPEKVVERAKAYADFITTLTPDDVRAYEHATGKTFSLAGAMTVLPGGWDMAKRNAG